MLQRKGKWDFGVTGRTCDSLTTLVHCPAVSFTYLDIYLLCKHTNLKDTAGKSATLVSDSLTAI